MLMSKFLKLEIILSNESFVILLDLNNEISFSSDIFKLLFSIIFIKSMAPKEDD